MTDTAAAAEPVPDDWQPKLVCLDIDGTLLRWVDGTGTSHATINPPVKAAVRRAQAAGAHVVLASGRSPHGMTPIADALELERGAADGRNWIVASNGAVVVRHPDFEVVQEVTFDAREAVTAVLGRHPEALVAVEDRDLEGYRVNRPFPKGELSGELVPTDLETMIAEPVSRVIIRDPSATADEFVALAAGLGLSGINYFVGWTAWLDLQPVGVSKAYGLDLVARELGVTAADALAIGDGRNDLEMLRWARRGVAMGQAVDEVHQAADASTGHVDSDGAARELERWFG